MLKSWSLAYRFYIHVQKNNAKSQNNICAVVNSEVFLQFIPFKQITLKCGVSDVSKQLKHVPFSQVDLMCLIVPVQPSQFSGRSAWDTNCERGEMCV